RVEQEHNGVKAPRLAPLSGPITRPPVSHDWMRVGASLRFSSATTKEIARSSTTSPTLMIPKVRRVSALVLIRANQWHRRDHQRSKRQRLAGSRWQVWPATVPVHQADRSTGCIHWPGHEQ